MNTNMSYLTLIKNIMPLFGNKFSPKRTPMRKNGSTLNPEKLEELVGELRTVTLNLGTQELVFNNGEWTSGAEKDSYVHKLNQKLRQKNEKLREENNLLKSRYEVILNMLTQTTAESHNQEKELESLRKLLKQ